jgi:hypothetical protein
MPQTDADPAQFQSFQEFWPYYVRQHLHPVNRALHFVGLTIAMRLVARGLRKRRLAPLVMAPIAGYGLSWIGHYFFEHNTPATFGHPLWSLRADFHMWKQIAQRKMESEIEQVLANP